MLNEFTQHIPNEVFYTAFLSLGIPKSSCFI